MPIRFKPVARRNPISKRSSWYPQVVVMHRITIDRIAQEIEESCTLHESDIKAVIVAFARRMISHLQDGNSVNLGDLGTFHVSVRGQGGEPILDSKKITADSIRSSRVVYVPGPGIRKSLSRDAKGVRFERLSIPGEKKDTGVMLPSV